MIIYLKLKKNTESDEKEKRFTKYGVKLIL